MDAEQLIKFVEQVKETTGYDTKQLAEKLDIPVAVVREIERGLFPHPVFEGLLIAALSGLCFEKNLDAMNKILEERDEITGKVARSVSHASGEFIRKPGGGFEIKLFPATEESGD